jgi:hypothetical protein
MDRTLVILERPEHRAHEECAAAIRQAVALRRDPRASPSPETIEHMGGGWGPRRSSGGRALLRYHRAGRIRWSRALGSEPQRDAHKQGAIAANLVCD